MVWVRSKTISRLMDFLASNRLNHSMPPWHDCLVSLTGRKHWRFPPPSRGCREGRVPDWNRQMSMGLWFKSLFFVVHLILVSQWSRSFWPWLCRKLIQKVVRLVNHFIYNPGSSGMLVIVLFQGPYNLSFDYPKKVERKTGMFTVTCDNSKLKMLGDGSL